MGDGGLAGGRPGSGRDRAGNNADDYVRAAFEEPRQRDVTCYRADFNRHGVMNDGPKRVDCPEHAIPVTPPPPPTNPFTQAPGITPDFEVQLRNATMWWGNAEPRRAGTVECTPQHALDYARPN
ncbi:hypothetical protein ACWGE0_24345 [Lentzea sp. NPDC054927]